MSSPEIVKLLEHIEKELNEDMPDSDWMALKNTSKCLINQLYEKKDPPERIDSHLGVFFQFQINEALHELFSRLEKLEEKHND